SRRRHTTFSRDWSSDVCSSDLPENKYTSCEIMPMLLRSEAVAISFTLIPSMLMLPSETSNNREIKLTSVDLPAPECPTTPSICRSEERRVGKGRRTRGGGCTDN